MPGTISHALSMTSPNDPAYENQPQHWNSSHLFTLNASGSEISNAFNNGGGVTFGLETNGSITAAAPAGAPSPVNFSAGTTSNNLASVVFSNSNGVSFGLNGSTITGTVKTDYLTTAMASNRGSDFVQATAAFHGTSASGTIASDGISVSIGPYLTTAMQSNAATISNIKISAGTASQTRSDVTFNDSNGVSFGLGTGANAGVITATVKTDYQSSNANYLTSQSNQNVTAGNGGFAFQTLSFSNVNGVSFGTSAGSAITASHNALTSQSNQAASASNGSFTFQTLGFSNANNVTFGTSAGSIVTASVAAPGAAAENNAINLLGANTAGNTTATGSTIGWSGINATLSGTNNSQVVISVPATSSLVGTLGIQISTAGSTISIEPPTLSMHVNIGAGFGTGSAGMTHGSHSNGTVMIFPLNPAHGMFPGQMTVDRAAILWSASHTNTSATTQQFSSTFALGFYTQKNATQLSRIFSGSWTTQGTANANNSSLFHGLRWISFASGQFDTQPTFSGDQYWGAIFALSGGTSFSGSGGPMVVRAGASNPMSGVFGSASASANSNANRFPFDGYLSVSTNALPANLGLSDIIHTGSGYAQMYPYLVMMDSNASGGFGFF